jgi:hypothetical protein
MIVKTNCNARICGIMRFKIGGRDSRKKVRDSGLGTQNKKYKQITTPLIEQNIQIVVSSMHISDRGEQGSRSRRL